MVIISWRMLAYTDPREGPRPYIFPSKRPDADHKLVPRGSALSVPKRRDPGNEVDTNHFILCSLLPGEDPVAILQTSEDKGDDCNTNC